MRCRVVKLAQRPSLRRVVALDRMIRSGDFPNAGIMAAALEVNRRTIYRDLDFLRDSWSAPLEYCPRHNGFYYSDPDFSLPLLRLSEGELIALFLAERLMQQFRGTPYAKQLATAFQKLTARLPDEVTIDLSHIDESISFRGVKTDVGDRRRFRQLVRAVRERHQLELVYWSASRDQMCRRVVDPYHLTSVQGDWYLVGFCHLREDVRMFAPARIQWLKETGERFDRPADFCINRYLDGSFRTMRGDAHGHHVRLRFTAEAARWVREKEWHPSQRIHERKDGSIELTLTVTHLLEVQRWVMGYGCQCEVLEPAELREAVREEFRRGVEIYKRQHW